MKDVTEQLLHEARSSYGGNAAKRAGKANPRRLSSRQENLLDRFDGKRLPFVSRVLLYGTGLGKRDTQALVGLLRGGVLRVFQVQGSLRSFEPGLPAYVVGADQREHYLVRRSEEEVQS